MFSRDDQSRLRRWRTNVKVISLAFLVSMSILTTPIQARDMTDCEARARLILQVAMLRENCPQYPLTEYGATREHALSGAFSAACGEGVMERVKLWLVRDIVRGNSQLRPLADQNKKTDLTLELCATVAAELNKQSHDNQHPLIVAPASLPTDQPMSRTR
jgi:hypothetical protein